MNERMSVWVSEPANEGVSIEWVSEWMNEWMNERYLCTVVTSIFKIGFQISREDNSTWPKDSAFTAVKMDAKL